MIEKNKLLISKLNDQIESIDRGKTCVTTQFCSFDQNALVENYLCNKQVYFSKFGGYDGSERNIFFISRREPDYIYYPITALFFDMSYAENISHKDVLGALMSLGIKREFIGDIIFFDNKCVFFALDSISSFIIDNFTTVRHCSIKVLEYSGQINYSKEYEQLFITVSSMRLDCLVCELANVSRSNAVAMIESGNVVLNGIECFKKDNPVYQNDILSIRKNGKYRVAEESGGSKKGKIKLNILKYI